MSKVWGPSDVYAISNEMVRQNRGKPHGYSHSDILHAISHTTSQQYLRDKNIQEVANHVISTYGGAGSSY